MLIYNTIKKARQTLENIAQSVGFKIGIKHTEQELKNNDIFLWYKHITNLTASSRESYGVYNINNIESIRQGDGVVLYSVVSFIFSFFSRDANYNEILEKLEQELKEQRARVSYINDSYNSELKLHFLTYKIDIFIYE